MNARFAGEILLACGHGWPGTTDTVEEANRFVALCVATGDTALCPECRTRQLITGPLVARPAVRHPQEETQPK